MNHGEVHGIVERLPRSRDDILVYSDCGPLLIAILGLHQDSRDAIENANLVVREREIHQSGEDLQNRSA